MTCHRLTMQRLIIFSRLHLFSWIYSFNVKYSWIISYVSPGFYVFFHFKLMMNLTSRKRRFCICPLTKSINYRMTHFTFFKLADNRLRMRTSVIVVSCHDPLPLTALTLCPFDLCVSSVSSCLKSGVSSGFMVAASRGIHVTVPAPH